MTYLLIVLAWLAVGTAVGIVEARRGRWRRGWVVFAILGPFAVPLALGRRSEPTPEPVVLTTGTAAGGSVDVLVGLDGSAASEAAAELAVGLLGGQVRTVTLATVLDLDTGAPHGDSLMHPEPWPEEQEARRQLARGADALEAATGHDATTVVLTGEPAAALERYAGRGGYHVVVIGTRGRGLTKSLLGSCATKLARQSSLPVLLVPAGSRGPSTGAPTGTLGSVAGEAERSR
jgi:nucleotide-binding universal stress UspA family protein